MIKIERDFTSILFLGSFYDRTKQLKASLSHFPFLKTFESSHLDEARQIIDMSTKTVVLVDNENALQILLKYSLADTKGSYKVFYVDWDFVIDKDRSASLKTNGITVIKSKEFPPVYERLEMYLYGKTNVFEKHGFLNSDQKIPDHGHKGFLTIIEVIDYKWRMVASTHEQINNIDQVIGKNWKNFLDETLTKAHLLTEPQETQLDDKPYLEIITPYIRDDKVWKISISHINTETTTDVSIDKIKSFLQSIG